MTDAVVVRDEHFDRKDQRHVEALRRLYAAYMSEQLMQGRIGVGAPAAPYLGTVLFWNDDAPIGFVSFQVGKGGGQYGLELIYLAPEYRNQGLARSIVEDMKASCPGSLVAHGPATPAGAALALACGLTIVGVAPEEAKIKEQEMMRTLSKECRHRRGRPDTPCRTCCKRKASEVARLFAHDLRTTGGVGVATGLF